MNRNFKYYGLIFSIGAVGYCLLELLWRGFTHPSMGIAGGLSFCLIAIIQKRLKPLNFVYRCIASGLGITVIELIFGGIFNLWLQRNVWDYSVMPFNLLGQVCLAYTVLWCGLSAPMLILTDILRQKFGLLRNGNTMPKASAKQSLGE